jgi:SpoVK/Ycf46/Vps4 family AAA+-type ATPase
VTNERPSIWHELPLEDLVLPASVLEELRRIAAWLSGRHEVYEDWTLFHGGHGTGKTMAAQALARKAGMKLFRVDLAALVSKFIGETEKNLSRVFDAAAEAGAMLLFDEADTLFGKRSEVKDAHDRLTNVEIACLLQRFEQYERAVVFATKDIADLDAAFLRRVRFVVDFRG